MDEDRAAEVAGRLAADPVREGLVVTDLVTRARTGVKRARDALAERYAPLTWPACRGYRPDRADAG